MWDRGTWEPVGDPRKAMKASEPVFRLHGEKLTGLWELVRISKPEDSQDQWKMFKKRDEWARPSAEYDVIKALPDSVTTKPLGLVEERVPKVARPTPVAPSAIGLSVPVRASLPAKPEPRRATLASSLPTTGDWIIESKGTSGRHTCHGRRRELV
ncbi:hypothetical protein [Paraburkholderia strydomiana]